MCSEGLQELVSNFQLKLNFDMRITNINNIFAIYDVNANNNYKFHNKHYENSCDVYKSFQIHIIFYKQQFMNRFAQSLRLPSNLMNSVSNIDSLATPHRKNANNFLARLITQERGFDLDSTNSDYQHRRKIPKGLRKALLKSGYERANIGKNVIKEGQKLKIVKSVMTNNVCPLCQTQASQSLIGICGQKCHHKFCLFCLKQYLTYKVQTKSKIFCPNQQCKEQIDKNDSFFKKLPRVIKEGIAQQSYQQLTTMKCPSLKRSISDLSGYGQQSPRHQKQEQNVCSDCKLSHQSTCQSHFYNNLVQWKKCPKCHNYLAKELWDKNFTDHHRVSCQCGENLCFNCLKKWNSSQDHFCNTFLEIADIQLIQKQYERFHHKIRPHLINDSFIYRMCFCQNKYLKRTFQTLMIILLYCFSILIGAFGIILLVLLIALIFAQPNYSFLALGIVFVLVHYKILRFLESKRNLLNYSKVTLSVLLVINIIAFGAKFLKLGIHK